MRFHGFFQEFHWAAISSHVKIDETRETLKFRNSPAACLQVGRSLYLPRYAPRLFRRYGIDFSMTLSGCSEFP